MHVVMSEDDDLQGSEVKKADDKEFQGKWQEP